MYRIAKQSPFLPVREQPCRQRPALTLQPSVSQIDIVFPDHIRFCYPGVGGHAILQDVDVHALGENAHGVCFLVGAYRPRGEAQTGQSSEAEAFRIDAIDGPITRVATGEVLSVNLWERRVRRRFAMDRDTDALPLSSMLITAKENDADMPD